MKIRQAAMVAERLWVTEGKYSKNPLLQLKTTEKKNLLNETQSLDPPEHTCKIILCATNPVQWRRCVTFLLSM